LLQGGDILIKVTKRALLLLLAALAIGGTSGCGNNSSSGIAPATEQIFYAQSVVFANESTAGGRNLWGAGYNAYGQLGNGMLTTTQAYFTPVAFGPVHGYAAGANHTLAFTGSTIYAWGSNFRGRLGAALETSGGKAYTAVPMLVRSLFPDGTIQPRMPDNVVSVAAGWLHSLAVAGPNRSVYAWGANNIGQLGNGIVTNLADSPFAIPVFGESGAGSSLNRIKQVAAGGSHSLALNDDGVVFAWGDNAWGQVGDILVNDAKGQPTLQSFVPVPVRVPGLPAGVKVKKIAAAGSYSLALMEDGTVWGWGYNAFGQLGRGSASFSTPAPLQVITGKDSNDKDIPLQNVQDIQAGVLHALALVQSTDGSYQVWSWGANDKGQLGTGYKGSGNPATPQTLGISQAVPATVANDLIAASPAASVSIYAFGNQSFVRIGGNLYGWGDNGSGELGYPVTSTSLGYLLQAVRINVP
jgi:alpha-tubulin suppressor-like RCC1 family protein